MWFESSVLQNPDFLYLHHVPGFLVLERNVKKSVAEWSERPTLITLLSQSELIPNASSSFIELSQLFTIFLSNKKYI